MTCKSVVVLWDVFLLVGQGHKTVKPSMLRAYREWSRSTIYRTLGGLVEMGIVKRVGHGRYALVANSVFVYDLLDALRVMDGG